MSDFGTMMIVQRVDAANMDNEDRSRLDQAIQTIRGAGRYQDAVGEPMSFQVVGSRGTGGRRDLAIVLSAYWMEEGDEEGYGLSPEELLATDRPVAQTLGRLLAEALGPRYAVEVICDHW